MSHKPTSLRHCIALFFVLALAVIGVLSQTALAADLGDATRVLLVTGGHGFRREPFLKMLRDDELLDVREAKNSASAEAFERDELPTYDVLLLYDMTQNVTDLQKARFLRAIDRGVGLVVLHHALVSFQHWPEYERIIGGRYPEDQTRRGEVTPALGYRHDVDIPVTIVAKKHPITQGLDDFTIRDEIYWGYRVSQDVIPLIATTHADSGNPLAWARREGNARVVYIQLGDSPTAFSNPNYRRLLSQSIQWADRGR
jgi:type 1 glutamine amidotransferase